VTTIFSLFSLDKNNRERKKKRQNKNTCEYEREGCFKSCQKIIVQISFLLKKEWKVFTRVPQNHNSNLKLYSIKKSEKFLYKMSHHLDSNLRKIQAFKIRKTYSTKQNNVYEV